MTVHNLHALYARADRDDIAEGRRAYVRYNAVLRGFSDIYGVDFRRTVAAFVALSPNNDYFSNLRSLASVLRWRDQPNDRITVSTYNHCKHRALSYIRGQADFLRTVKGPKVRSFYSNIVRPSDPLPVTVDGHIHAAYRDKDWTMREAILRNRREYDEIAAAVREVGRAHRLKGHQAQAILWFARKRTLGIVYQPQMRLFAEPGDLWQSIVHPDDAPFYPLKEADDAHD